MVLTKDISTLPTTLEEFMVWESEDGFKYEWNDGELIKFYIRGLCLHKPRM